MPLTFDHRGFRDVQRQLKQLGQNARDLTPVWPLVGNYLARANRETFATRGSRLGRPWKPLAPSTQRDKLRGGWPRAPLVRTGALKFSLVGRPMAIERYRRQSASFGSDRNTAVWQDRGTHRNGKRHIPPRKLVGLTRDDKSNIFKLVKRHILGRRTGLRK